MVRDMLGLNTIDLNSPISKNHQRDIKGNLLFTSDPDYCCHLNKVQPMEAVLIEYDVWISGVRSDQTANRKSFQTIDRGPFNILRYHPMLKWTAADISGYINKYQLPSHPLEKQGYTSMGCMPCTRKTMSSNMNNRDGRWVGLTKTECGLHTELVRK
jgi:phosphoadenosine phosphosulfate reductase